MIIISGPSTVGKNPFIYKACSEFDLNYVIPYTTRDMRTEELNGKDYYFLSKEEFQLKIRNLTMSEWDYCLDNYYGYVFESLQDSRMITHGLSRMALRIKKKYPNDITTVFLMPTNMDAIFNAVRKIYVGKTLVLREALIKEEITHSVLFDKVFYVEESVYDLLDNGDMVRILQKK